MKKLRGNKKAKESISLMCFTFACELFAFKTIFGRLEAVDLIGGLLIITQMLLLVFCVILNIKKTDAKKSLLYAMAIILASVSYAINRNYNIVLLILALFASQGIDTRSFLKRDYKCKMVFLLINFALLLLGITEDTVFVREDGAIRHTLGFDSPNTFGIIVLSILTEVFYVYKKKIKKKYCVLLPVIAVSLLVFFNSRNSVYAILLLWAMILLYDKIKFWKAFVVAPIILVIVSFGMMMAFGAKEGYAERINDVTTGRLIAPYNYYKKNGIKLLGNKIERNKKWQGYVDVIDNSYLDLLIEFGWLLSIIVVALNTSTYRKIIKEKDKAGLLILLTYSAIGLMEKVLLSTPYCMVWFLTEGKNDE